MLSSDLYVHCTYQCFHTFDDLSLVHIKVKVKCKCCVWLVNSPGHALTMRTECEPKERPLCKRKTISVHYSDSKSAETIYFLDYTQTHTHTHKRTLKDINLTSWSVLRVRVTHWFIVSFANLLWQCQCIHIGMRNDKRRRRRAGWLPRDKAPFCIE